MYHTNSTENGYLSILYFAYGANLNLRAMQHRCPAAIPHGPYRLDGYRLVFRTVADIEPAPVASVHGVLWHITPTCLRSLDRFEGYPTLYDHQFFQLDNGIEVLFYQMNETGYGVPPEGYYEDLRQGYEDFALPQSSLTRAYTLTEQREEVY
jgi:gamma-glutamylcyclotransferase (GGCT)/AIG2-like uncharacterized protein YtfP